ncbi:hypothetical protein H8959_019576 [Pygathrix nigripes]
MKQRPPQHRRGRGSPNPERAPGDNRACDLRGRDVSSRTRGRAPRGRTCMVMAALGDHGEVRAPARPEMQSVGDPRRAPSPARHWRPGSSWSPRGEAAGTSQGAKPRSVALASGTHPRSGAAPPRPGSFGAQPRPPHGATVPGRGRARQPFGPPGDPRRAPRPSPARWPARAGSRARGGGAGGAVGRRCGLGPGPHVSLPGGPIGARLSERSPYMDMFWGRARRRAARARRFRLNSGGGGRGRSQSPPSARAPCSFRRSIVLLLRR